MGAGDLDPYSFDELESLLLRLLCGEHSSLSLGFNDHASNYQTAAQAEAAGHFEHFDWVSEAEHAQAIASNRVWVLHWYPNTPVAFSALAAFSLEALIEAATKEGGA